MIITIVGSVLGGAAAALLVGIGLVLAALPVVARELEGPYESFFFGSMVTWGFYLCGVAAEVMK